MPRHRTPRRLLAALALCTPSLAVQAASCTDQQHAQLFKQVMQAARSDKVDMKRFETDYLSPFLRCHRNWE